MKLRGDCNVSKQFEDILVILHVCSLKRSGRIIARTLSHDLNFMSGIDGMLTGF